MGGLKRGWGGGLKRGEGLGGWGEFKRGGVEKGGWGGGVSNKNASQKDKTNVLKTLVSAPQHLFEGRGVRQAVRKDFISASIA